MNEEYFVWARWLKCDDVDTDEDAVNPDEWQVVFVFDNNSSQEPQRVMVCGVATSQPMSNFEFGQRVAPMRGVEF